MIDAPLTGDEEIAAAADVLLRPSGGAALYDVLEQLATRRRLPDAWLVLQPGAAGPQVFRRARWAAPPETVAALLARPAGVYTDPAIDPATSRAVAVLCDAAFRAACSEADAAHEPTTGLAGRNAIDAALARAAARGARYGWTSTAVLLSTVGEAPADHRWKALTAALRMALRTGDEAGPARRGRALAILPHAGPDAIRPFLARLRAALSGLGGDGIDLVAATATTPTETVDPAEMKRLASERLAGVAGEGDPEASGAIPDPADLWRLEVDLRMVAGVVSVGFASKAEQAGLAVTVVAQDVSGALQADLALLVEEAAPGASLTVLPLAGDGPRVDGGLRALDHQRNGNGSAAEVPEGRPAGVPSTPPLLSATAPGRPEGTGRASLVRAAFDADRGLCEVTLSLGGARGTGRAPAGPLAGGAQATLTAIAALGLEVPFYLVSAERARGIPGEPVVVVLAPRQAASAASKGTGERLGVAGGEDDVAAASRATLGALNRHLAHRATRR